MGLKLRVILDTAGRPPWWQMALDEALLNHVAAGGSPPTLRLYRFAPTSVTIGYFQSLSRSVHLEEAERLGVPVVRRFTGGGAVVHPEDGELTYSISLPAEGRMAYLGESYRILCSAVADALKRLGVEAEYVPPNDVVVRGRKVSGNAQARRRGALLQHGTILYRAPLDLMERLLVVPREKLESHGASSLRDRVTSLEAEAGRAFTPLEIADALTAAIAEALGAETVEGWYTRSELEEAERLAPRYRSREWLLRRP
jgi:lipoate-protein ligase A